MQVFVAMDYTPMQTSYFMLLTSCKSILPSNARMNAEQYLETRNSFTVSSFDKMSITSLVFWELPTLKKKVLWNAEFSTALLLSFLLWV